MRFLASMAFVLVLVFYMSSQEGSCAPAGVKFGGCGNCTFYRDASGALERWPPPKECTDGKHCCGDGCHTVYLAYNGLTSLPADVFKGMGELVSLGLSRNELISLPAGLFKGMGALTTLDLSYNELLSLPAGLFDDIGGLQTLDLYRNPLFGVQPAGLLEPLMNLSTLRLSTRGGRRSDPLCFREMPSRLIENMSDCPRVDDFYYTGLGSYYRYPRECRLCPFFCPGQKIEAGRCGNCAFYFNTTSGALVREPPADSQECVGGDSCCGHDCETFQLNLSSLHATRNGSHFGCRLPGEPEAGIFKGLGRLKHINFAGQRLTSLPSGIFSDLGRLETLNLADNSLSSLSSDALVGLTRLKELDVRNNSLQELSLPGSMPCLEEFLVADNPFLSRIIGLGNRFRPDEGGCACPNGFTLVSDRTYSNYEQLYEYICAPDFWHEFWTQVVLPVIVSIVGTWALMVLQLWSVACEERPCGSREESRLALLSPSLGFSTASRLSLEASVLLSVADLVTDALFIFTIRDDTSKCADTGYFMTSLSLFSTTSAMLLLGGIVAAAAGLTRVGKVDGRWCGAASAAWLLDGPDHPKYPTRLGRDSASADGSAAMLLHRSAMLPGMASLCQWAFRRCVNVLIIILCAADFHAVKLLPWFVSVRADSPPSVPPSPPLPVDVNMMLEAITTRRAHLGKILRPEQLKIAPELFVNGSVAAREHRELLRLREQERLNIRELSRLRERERQNMHKNLAENNFFPDWQHRRSPMSPLRVWSFVWATLEDVGQIFIQAMVLARKFGCFPSANLAATTMTSIILSLLRFLQTQSAIWAVLKPTDSRRRLFDIASAVCTFICSRPSILTRCCCTCMHRQPERSEQPELTVSTSSTSAA